MADDVTADPYDQTDDDGLTEENVRLRAELDAMRRQRWYRSRSITSVALVVLAAIAAVASMTGYWLRSTLLDSDRFVETLESTLDSEEFRLWLSSTVSDEVVTALDLEARLEDRLDGAVPGLSFLAGPVANGVDSRIRARIDDFVQSAEVPDLVFAAVGRAHEAAVAVIRGEATSSEDVNVVDGEVRLNLIPMITAGIATVLDSELSIAGADITLPDVAENGLSSEAVARLGGALGIDLPADFGQVTVLTNSKYRELQSGVRLLDRSVWLLIFLSVAFTAASLWVSPHPRRTLVQLGIGTAVALLVSQIVINNISESIKSSVADSDARGAVSAVIDGVVMTLTATLVWATIAAVVVGLVAYLAGRSQQVRGRIDDFAGRHHDGLVVLGLVVALLVLWALGVTLVSVLAIGGMLALFVRFLSVSRQRADNGRGAEEPTAAVRG